MALTTAQLATLKADILAKQAGVLAGKGPFDGTGDNPGIAAYYNTLASPQVLLWRPDVGVDEAKKAVNWVDYKALAQANRETYLGLTQGTTLDATAQGIRDAFTTVFGASASLTALTTLAQAAGTNGQVLYAGAVVQGARVSPLYGQQISADDVALALRS